MGADGVAVLLMAYGGPDKLDDVEPYLLDVRGGRATSRELVDEIKARYARIGGRSPIRELTEAQARALGHALGPEFAVYVGMRHWHPYIGAALERIVAAGHRRLVGIVLAPHYSAMSVGAYEKKVLDAAAGRVQLALVRSWGDHPGFLDAVAARVMEALRRFPSRNGVQVIFTAHSLPQRILAQGDPYPDQLRVSAAAVGRLAGLPQWHFAYQSAGATPAPTGLISLPLFQLSTSALKPWHKRPVRMPIVEQCHTGPSRSIVRKSRGSNCIVGDRCIVKQ